MDAETQQKIIHSHGHLVSSKLASQVNVKARFSVEDSGPPSPSSGPVSNFGEVAPGIYRSSFPHPCNLEHIRSLGLKSILTLVTTPHSDDFVEFVEEQGIEHFRIEIPAHKNPSVTIPTDTLLKTLKIILDPSNHPLLIHCNKGKHRTGCMIACYRKLHGWTDPAVITEYRSFAGDKFRPLDEAFMKSFNAEAACQILQGATITYVPLSTEPVPWSGKKPSSLETGSLPTPPPSEKDAEDEL